MAQDNPVIQEDAATQNEGSPTVVHQPRVGLHRVYYLLGATALFLVLSVFLFLRWMINVEAYHFQIISSLENITGHPVSLGKVAFSPTGGLFTLELQDLEIHAQEPTEPPLLRVKKVQIGMTPLSFFHKITQREVDDWHLQLDISSLTLIQPQMNILQRRDTWLMRWAQDTAQRSDKKIEREFGLGLTDISIGSIKIQSGIMTLLNGENPDGHTLVFDRIQAGMHALSPNRASPVSLSARFQTVPFTLNGQIGPLPNAFDFAELPVLLSLEAKSGTLPQLKNIFTNPFIPQPHTINIHVARGYFSTLFYGTLKKGMRTSSRVELDKLVVDASLKKENPSSDNPSTDIKKAQQEAQETQQEAGKQQKTDAQTISTAAWETKAGTAMDWAFRQKSVLRLENSGFFFQIEELFLYLDRKPILDVKGVFDRGEDGFLDLKLTTLGSVRLEQFPYIFFPYLSGDSLQGTLHIHGSWPDSIALSAKLDLSPTAFSFPPPLLPSQTSVAESPTARTPSSLEAVALWLQKMGVGKKAGVPLFLNLNLVYEKTWHGKVGQENASLTLENTILSRSPILLASTPGHHFHLSGTLLPAINLNMMGEWALSLLNDFLPKTNVLDVSGLARMQMTFSTPKKTDEHESGTPTSDLPLLAEGYLRSDNGHWAGIPFENFFTRIKLKKALLHFSGIEIQVGSGRLDGYLQVDLSKPQTSYQTLFAFAGITVEELLNKSRYDLFRVEGLAFGQGHIRGSLDDHFFPIEPLFGNLHLEIEPGRMTGMDRTGIDGDLFLRPPADAQVIFGHQEPQRQARIASERTGQEHVVQKETGQARSSGKQENLANPKKAFYWDQLEMDIALHNSLLRFNNVHLKSGGLQIFGRGTWDLFGPHTFDLEVHPSLKKGNNDPFSVWVGGDKRQTVYKPVEILHKNIPH